MSRIDFVPEDYIQRKESRRSNFFYLMLVGIISLSLLGTFAFLKVRQKAIVKDIKSVDKRMAQVQESIKQLESLQTQRQQMMKTALLAAELIEQAPRSIILALLTNAMPQELSLERIEITQKKQQSGAAKVSNQYEAVKKAAEQKSQEQYLTELEIEGLAASDIGVADYIASLSRSKLLQNVCLVHSMQKKIAGITYRQFKLTAQLAANTAITNADVEEIRDFKPVKSGI